jgi:hypothetical protein
MEEIQRALGRLESKVDILLARDADTEKRLAAVEKKQWWAAGVAAGLMGLIVKWPALAAFVRGA